MRAGIYAAAASISATVRGGHPSDDCLFGVAANCRVLVAALGGIGAGKQASISAAS